MLTLTMSLMPCEFPTITIHHTYSLGIDSCLETSQKSGPAKMPRVKLPSSTLVCATSFRPEGPQPSNPPFLAKLHARKVAKELRLNHGLIYLPGEPARLFEDSDQGPAFRQRR